MLFIKPYYWSVTLLRFANVICPSKGPAVNQNKSSCWRLTEEERAESQVDQVAQAQNMAVCTVV